jgi:hypothetical protein
VFFEVLITSYYYAMMSKLSTLQLIETDEAGEVVATYVQSSTAKRDITRVDRIVSTLQQINPEPRTQANHRYLGVPKAISRRCLMSSYQPDILIP